jgi:hypothetical protein
MLENVYRMCGQKNDYKIPITRPCGDVAGVKSVTIVWVAICIWLFKVWKMGPRLVRISPFNSAGKTRQTSFASQHVFILWWIIQYYQKSNLILKANFQFGWCWRTRMCKVETIRSTILSTSGIVTTEYQQNVLNTKWKLEILKSKNSIQIEVENAMQHKEMR